MTATAITTTPPKFHINKHNKIEDCPAQIRCRLGGTHFPTRAEAENYIKKQFIEGGELPSERLAPTPVRYSFKKDFEEQVEEFNKNFDGYPSRFFNADLRGKYLFPEDHPRLKNSNFLQSETNFPVVSLSTRLTAHASSPADFGTPVEELEAMAERLGFENFTEITDPSTLAAMNLDRAYFVTYETENGPHQVVLSGEAVNSKNFYDYSFRLRKEYPPLAVGKGFMMLDVRNFVGADRIHRKTGENIVANVVTNLKKSKNPTEARLNTLQVLKKLEEAQFEGRNFKQQQKYFRQQVGNIATAREDKKHPLPTHVQAARESTLRKYFPKIELDNDVDLEEFKQFEKDYTAIADKLPKVPKDKQPIFRVRYLGKHKANGIYFPAQNTVAVDIRNGGSAVHELLHQYDIAVKGNASLQKEFRNITKEYSKNLKLPAEISTPAKREYYTTPTEILARGGEYYFAEKLGIKNNRLLDVTKMDGFDYAPFKENPELKEEVFKFFDNFLKQD